jgi:aryl-alcohol dehydrogenase-like predicted oxidoreductase
MSLFNPPPKPTTPLACHRPLSPTASIKVSPLCLGGISIGSSWSPIYGKNEDAFALLDAFVAQGGNFIDTCNSYNDQESEKLIGEWMEQRGNRDEMVVATKFSAGYKAPFGDDGRRLVQSNFAGNSAKSMIVSVRDSLRKLRTGYIDLLYVHWSVFSRSYSRRLCRDLLFAALTFSRRSWTGGISPRQLKRS